jgi:hypothetical protein
VVSAAVVPEVDMATKAREVLLAMVVDMVGCLYLVKKELSC